MYANTNCFTAACQHSTHVQTHTNIQTHTPRGLSLQKIFNKMKHVLTRIWKSVLPPQTVRRQMNHITPLSYTHTHTHTHRDTHNPSLFHTHTPHHTPNTAHQYTHTQHYTLQT